MITNTIAYNHNNFEEFMWLKASVHFIVEIFVPIDLWNLLATVWPQLSKPLIIWTVVVTVLLKYFTKWSTFHCVTGVCSIRIVQCFIYRNEFTYLKTFVVQLALRCSDNGEPTVHKTFNVATVCMIICTGSSTWHCRCHKVLCTMCVV